MCKQHIFIYNHKLNKWNSNIKYNKKKYYIDYGSKIEFLNINNKKLLIISTRNKDRENYFYIFDFNKQSFINKIKPPKEFNNIQFEYHTFIKYDLVENKYIIMRKDKIIYFKINNNFNIKIIKQINNKLDYNYSGMSYLNLYNNYIITFGGYDGHYNNIYILNIKNKTFSTSKIKLKDKFYRSGCFIENKDTIHIFGGFYTNSHYSINLINILGLNLNNTSIIILNFIKNIKNIKWVKDLNKIIFNYIGYPHEAIKLN